MPSSIPLRTLTLATLLAGLPAGAAEYVVSQRDKTFSMENVTIRPGDTLVFRNDDPVNHNVFSAAAGLEFNLQSQKPGESSKVTLWTEGTTEVRCAFHPRMKLTVTVRK
jgi:plastocyanin